jgi:hypothetical protein
MAAAVFRSSPSLSARPRHFLNKQRNAISTLDYFLPNVLRQRLIAGNTVDQGSGFALAKAVDVQGGNIGSSNPRRLEIGSVGYD